MIGRIRRHLGWKLLVSYLVVILVGVIVLLTATLLVVPDAFGRHLATVIGTFGASSAQAEQELFTSFQNGVNEAVVLAALAAFVVAVLVSVLVTQQVIAPIRGLMVASQRIADGHYGERVAVPGDPARGELDELAQLAVTFNEMAARLEQVETMRRQLIADVAHELRTPLTSITGYMEGLIDGVLPADAATFQQAARETERLQRLVSDLQELSRVEAGAVALNLKAVPVETLVEAVTARLGRQFDEKGVSLQTSVPAGLPPVQANEDRIGQVLLNLVGNGLQYTPPGGRVLVRAARDGQMIRISVEDTGIGIDSEHLPFVFDRFYRVDKSRSRAGGGSGIGLTIARYLVEAHGGQIEAASPGLGKGSTFSFTVPIA